MSGIVGRADDMLVIRGVNVYPSQVEHTLLSVTGVAPHFQLVVRRQGTLDTLEVRCEHLADGADTNALAAQVTASMSSALGLTVSVSVEDPGSVPRSEGGKLARTKDERNLT